ncbi:mitochondrial assembly of ribosomal large subunit protein 1 [Anas platyrhynchos]|uniref:mitochondrial assembly of ribosomal large subunit protein 1 n=1 Tax=Anas platyrhynchos TaxID=8839 RepID=UPI000F7C2569|nr:mitochondrial assembly of ribosomal large subunit protein 1 [Anas platyrhynchos]|eukprot:XP_027306734.1 mitochondrial assembly of ribosomal large subunit protein 1 [Anas platyrhynchos]
MWRALRGGRRLLRLGAGARPRSAVAARGPRPLLGPAAGAEGGAGGGGGGGGSGVLRAVAEQRRAADTAKFNIDFVVALLRQENAKDICVIEVPPEMKYCNYFIVVSGSSTRHLHAMANYMMKMYKLQKEDSDPRAQIEGKETDDWLCIDFGSIVVHFMLPEARETYELEKLWTLGSYDDQLTQMTPQSLPEDFVLGLTSQQQWEGSSSCDKN